VLRGMARSAGMTALVVEHALDEMGASQSSRWMLCARDAARLREAGAVAEDGAREILWTDDASDLFSILKLRCHSLFFLGRMLSRRFRVCPSRYLVLLLLFLGLDR